MNSVSNLTLLFLGRFTGEAQNPSSARLPDTAAKNSGPLEGMDESKVAEKEMKGRKVSENPLAFPTSG